MLSWSVSIEAGRNPKSRKDCDFRLLSKRNGDAKDEVTGDTNTEKKDKKPTGISFDTGIVAAVVDASGKKEDHYQPNSATDKDRSEIV